MELVKGKNLRELLSSGMLPQSADLRINVLRKLLAAMAFAHQRKILHRDLKPENIILGEHYQVKLGDLGSARLLLPEHTQTQQFAGTLSYASPEQLRGEPLDARSDIYSLGVIGFELFGEAVRRENALPFLQSKTEASSSPQLPRQLRDIFLRATQKNLENRYSTCVEMLDALADFNDNQSLLKTFKYEILYRLQSSALLMPWGLLLVATVAFSIAAFSHYNKAFQRFAISSLSGLEGTMGLKSQWLVELFGLSRDHSARSNFSGFW